MQLKELRNKLKQHGFKVKTETLSWGRHATVIRIHDKAEMPSIFFDEAHRQEWIAAINILSQVEDLQDKDEKIYGCCYKFFWP